MEKQRKKSKIVIGGAVFFIVLIIYSILFFGGRTYAVNRYFTAETTGNYSLFLKAIGGKKYAEYYFYTDADDYMSTRNKRYSSIPGFGDIQDTDEITFEAVIGEWTKEDTFVYKCRVDLTYCCNGTLTQTGRSQDVYLKFNGLGWYVLSAY